MDVPVNYLTPPSDVVNQSIDKLGKSGQIIGALNDGTAISETARRNYGQVLRQLLRAAHWNFARKQSPLVLLGDASGQSAAPVSATVELPWTYAYAWPTDAVQGRWMPSGYPLPSGPQATPPVQGAQQPWMTPLLPGRFLVGSSDAYPIEQGSVPWSQLPDLRFTEGLGPIYRKVILTDIPPPATFVYTRLVTIIEEWDSHFREVMAHLMAIIVAPSAIPDIKERLPVVDRLKADAKGMLADARVANGNEAGWPQSTDHQPVWISARSAGYASPGAGLGVSAFAGGTLGVFLPYEPFSLGGSVF